MCVLCLPLSLSSPPALSPPAPTPGQPWAALSEAGGRGPIPVRFKANSPVVAGKPDVLPCTV